MLCGDVVLPEFGFFESNGSTLGKQGSLVGGGLTVSGPLSTFFQNGMSFVYDSSVMEINFTTIMSGGAKVVICKWGGHVCGARAAIG